MLKRLIPVFARSATAVKKNQYKKDITSLTHRHTKVKQTEGFRLWRPKCCFKQAWKISLGIFFRWRFDLVINYSDSTIFKLSETLSHGKPKLAGTGFSASASVGYPWLTDICPSNMVESGFLNLGILHMIKPRVGIKLTKKPSKFLDTTLVLSVEIINRQSSFHFKIFSLQTVPQCLIITFAKWPIFPLLKAFSFFEY